MFDPKFQLEPVEPNQRPPVQKNKKLMHRILFASLFTLLLISGALYGSLLWPNQPLAAESQLSTSAAPRLQLDSSLFDDQEALADLYQQVAPSVVSIRVTAQSSDRFLEGLPQQRGQGSGFIFDNEGHIVTNNHVVEDAVDVVVLFNNGFWADAEVVATDPQADLAVIKVTPPENFDWRPLPLAEPDSLRVGHTVIAVGNPFGLDSTMTTGIVSALGRGQSVGDGGIRYTLPEIIQTDAAINPGNSGGPLINLNGEVVGVNFAIQSAVRSNSGVGFTIPVSIVRRIVPALIKDGGFRYPFLGIQGQSIGPESADQLSLPDNQLGVYVASVVPGGPSDEAGLHGSDNGSGDIITAIDGVPVRGFEDLVGYLITDTSPEQNVTLTVLRDGQELDIDVVLGDRPGSRRLVSNQSPALPGNVNAREAIDIALKAVTDENLLEISGNITKIATPDEVDGVEVWVVELSSGNQTATVTVEKATGEVMEIIVE